MLQAIDRPNFGLIYEPANWMISGQDYVAAVQTVGRWIFNVYVQNHRLAADATDSVLSWQRGRVHLEHIGLWDSGGVDFEAVFAALHKIGYQGYVTVHQALAGVMLPQEAARRSYEYLVPRVSPPAERP